MLHSLFAHQSSLPPQYEAKLSNAYAATSKPKSRFEFWLVVVVRFKPPMSHHSTPLVLMGWQMVSLCSLVDMDN